MEFEAARIALKKRLQQEVASFYKRDNRRWKAPVVDMLRDLQKAEVEAVFFGGTLRSLLISRLFSSKPGRPRDIDIVVSGTSIESLKKRFSEILARETRFGGVQLKRREWQFDLWPLGKTWAFVRDAVSDPGFAELPSTTFFNLEAIAMEVWAKPGKSREIFSGDEQFFDGLLTKTLEINREENPFPELCVVRALVMAGALDFKIGPRLARYIAVHGEHMTADDLTDVQQKHYGHRRRDAKTLRVWIDAIAEKQGHNATIPIRLPIRRQLTLWPEPEEPLSLRLFALAK